MKKNIVGIPSPIKAENNKQILLCNTNRKLDDYLTSIKCRKDGKYSKIPNFFDNVYSQNLKCNIVILKLFCTHN